MKHNCENCKYCMKCRPNELMAYCNYVGYWVKWCKRNSCKCCITKEEDKYEKERTSLSSI